MATPVDSGKSVRTRTLQKAAAVLGGAPKLRDRLGVRTSELFSWMSGAVEPPDSVFARCVDILLDDLEREPDKRAGT